MTNCGDNISEKQLSKPQILELGICMLKILECLHMCGYVHNDLKMENMLLQGSKFFLIDFSACSEFIIGGQHIERQSCYTFNGNAHFATVT